MTKRQAIFPGSFDPFTNGHFNTVERASLMFDHVYIVVSTNTSKKELFSVSEKVDLIETAIKKLDNVTVVAEVNQLTVTVAQKYHANFLVRGIRNNQDFEYEKSISFMNRNLAPDIDTVFLLADEKYSSISSTMIKEVAKFGGKITDFVPENVEQALRRKLG
ncbi:pantetheine-phosphate adenylyltransferase [Vagococcus silagei]|uniref:Phosphopantetheine adenylyltransferase n=1 Tax=Vagococcus silagei TaxID=2508885 RepID=A0A4S3B460_9ENTE|nr:pantetheine-phosphate adenylyltransferase [Vagococcus silagei]THB61934.1 pantetheine-phosphate adenylyltransferase [Vagococcus silagei]